MTKISRICFITLVFMSATLPSYSGEGSSSDGNEPCAGNCDPGYYLDTDSCQCETCPANYYCPGQDKKKACLVGETSPIGSDSEDDCYFDCELYNKYKNFTGFGVNYAKGMCKAASGCYWNDKTDSCEYCPKGYYCDNTTTNGLKKQKCPLNSTSDPKSTNKLDCYLGSSNKICDSNNVCYKLVNNEKIYYWQTNAEFIQSETKAPAQFPEKTTCYPQDPLPCY